MSEPAAIRATFADFKLIKGRRVAQLVFEVPIEEADKATQTLGGMPQPATERWCGIALLQQPKASQEPTKEKRKWSDLPLSQKAAMRCQEPAFRKFLVERKGMGDMCDPADFVRKWCDVGSRKEFNSDAGARNAWIALDNEYYGWQRGVD